MKITNFQKTSQYVEITLSCETSQEWKKLISQAKQELGKNLQIKGFRTGKIPETVLDSKLKSNDILQRAGEIAKKIASDLVNKTHKVTLYGKYRPLISQVAKITFSELEIFQKWQKLPSIELKKIADFPCQLAKITVASKEIVTKLNHIAHYFASFEEKTGLATIGDHLVLDYQGKITNQVISELTKKATNYPLGSNQLGKDFDHQLINLAKGAKKTFTTLLPSDYYDAQLAGKKVTFSLTVLKVQEKKVPPIDNQLVSQLRIPDVKNLPQLEKMIEQNLMREKVTKLHPQVIALIWKKLISPENILLELDEVYLKEEAINVKNYHLRDLINEKKTLEEHLKATKKTKDEWEKEILVRTREILIDHLVVDYLANKNKITVQTQELEEYYQFLAKRSKETLAATKEKFSQLVLHNNLLRFKVEKELVNNTLIFNKIVPKDFFTQFTSPEQKDAS